ncbi:cation diffusion facilitator family transporter [Paracoccus sp. SCSIO 75233]|uniref:cation diffusion facilitator family transporter n=1 Tax=Paracoccus sp. SCSIO 75233 TaxID=3017782 RepID=UPI0022F0FB30|nr:cation diffusion facilitator family transporter [Paracoccus sp. SCSIO 75233]WBU53704.1 cation diffusion facilitator family transporter [Paracoccus sp. SCSIO 75233]
MSPADTHGEGHDHDHSHTPPVTSDNERKVLLSFFLIASFMVVEVIGGLISGSLALLADAGHMLTDAAALGLSYLAFRLGRRPADEKRTFGYGRSEVVASLLNATTLFLIAGWIIYEAWTRLWNPQPVLAGSMMAVAVAGLLVNILVLWILSRGDKDHVNIQGASLHVMGDLLGSVGAILAAIIIWFTGWTPADPILSVFVSLLILRSAWALMKNALNILLEGTPKGAEPAEIRAYLTSNVPGLAAVEHIHVWSITSGKVMATMHVRPENPGEARAVVEAVERALNDEFDIAHATVAISWEGAASHCKLSGADDHDHAEAGHGSETGTGVNAPAPQGAGA